ncbi:hypothetical protein R3W88_027311 [Solanum pinnatisectum]|uniref:Reverse transcriptase n=1 Tax=Solanum pinnatisectum TaxID=50273 RepID=A0AAV9LGW7_9SOLN|nr:hypothetical protein R3W88_027311 [Solanum pinnatisectum]
MERVTELECFEFHTKCKTIRLNHLCFANDILVMFSKGTFISIVLMLRGLKVFSLSSGLNTNEVKSNIFSANMKHKEVEDLCELTGIPIASKKISAIDCEVLIDKMFCRIKSWGSKHLSYSWRVQLVNSILPHIHSYWATTFLLPRKILKQITNKADNKYLSELPMEWSRAHKQSPTNSM